MITKPSILKHQALIVLIGILLFVPFLGSVHLFDWDEINFAECAREMIVTHDYFSVKINYLPFWEKPPVFIWMQALSMNLFGINEFAARLPNAICGIATLLILFSIGSRLKDSRFGWIWVMVYAASFLPHFYFKSGIIDPWFNLFIFLGIHQFILFVNQESNPNRRLIFSGLFIGLAIMTKGPVALLVFGLCFSVYWIMKRGNTPARIPQLLLFAAAVLAVGCSWFLMLWLTGNPGIIKEFFLYQVRLFQTEDAGHGGPFYYHWIVLLIGCFPMSVFALRGFKRSPGDPPFQQLYALWMKILFLVVLILFSIVKTKIIHYSSLCYFPMSFLAAVVVSKLYNGELKWKKSSSWLIGFLVILIGLAISAFPIIDHFKEKIIQSDLIKDPFAVANFQADVQWSGFEWLIGFGMIAGTMLMLWFIKRNKMQSALIGIFVCSLLGVNLASLLITPRIEPFSQGAAIEFYHYLEDKDVYVETLGFKSYAYLFYSAKREQQNPEHSNVDWLLNGNVDKPVYFVSKITYVDDVKQYHPQLHEIYRKNGFVFWKR